MCSNQAERRAWYESLSEWERQQLPGHGGGWDALATALAYLAAYAPIIIVCLLGFVAGAVLIAFL